MTAAPYTEATGARPPIGEPAGTQVDTHCPYCALQCGMTLVPDGTGSVQVRARDLPSNGGGLCQKGWTSATLLTSPDGSSTSSCRRSIWTAR